MKRWPQKTIKLLYATGVAALAYLSADATAAVVRSSIYDVDPVVWQPKPLRKGNDGPPAMSARTRRVKMGEVRDTLDRRNPFCPQCRDEVTAPVDATTADKPGLLAAGEPETELPLQLLATMEAINPAQSLATIRREDDGAVGVFAPGDTCAQGARIYAVGHGMVHLDVGGRLEYLELVEHETRKRPRRKRNKKKRNKKRRRKRRSWEIEGAKDAIDCENHRCSVDRGFVTKLLANPAKLTRQAKVRPAPGDETGFRLYRVRRNSVPWLLGIRSGDVLQSVNGHELGSIDDAMATYQRMRNASRLELTIDRRGKTVTKVLDIG